MAAVGMYAAIQAFYFVTPQTGYVLAQGAPDALYVTHDGGETWSLLPKLPPPDTYYSVAFIDEQTGFLTQSSGGVLVTRDGGQTFNAVNQGGLSFPYHYEFINALEGVMSGGKQLYWTGDGGTTWSSVLQTGGIHAGGIHAERIIEVDLQPDGGIWVLSVEFTRTGRGDEIYLWFSPDRGASWQRIDFGKDDPRTYPSFDFSDALHGWLRTSDHLYATADGGRTWEMVR